MIGMFFFFLNYNPHFSNNELGISGGLLWGVERSLSKLKPNNEMGCGNEIVPGLAA